MDNPIIGYEWSDSEWVNCEPCGSARIRNAPRRNSEMIKGPEPIPIHANELTWDDGIRCNDCGTRLCGPAPPPKSFEQAWAARMTRRAEAAVARADSEA